MYAKFIMLLKVEVYMFCIGRLIFSGGAKVCHCVNYITGNSGKGSSSDRTGWPHYQGLGLQIGIRCDNWLLRAMPIVSFKWQCRTFTAVNGIC